jgi:HEAT repeat protein
MSTQRNITELLDAYQNYLLSKVGQVRILGEAEERALKDVFIELRITTQRASKHHAEILNVSDSALRRPSDPIEGTERYVSPKPSRRSQKELERHVMPDELLRRGTKAIVAGMPGCGKTTLLKYLALQAQEKEQRLVVWLELKALDKALFSQAEKAAARAGSFKLLELWLRHLKVQLSLSDAEAKLLRQHWQIKFRAGEIIVLLDGFDELQDEAVERSANKCISEFVSASHDNPILVSTRPYAQHALGSEQLQELEIEPLNHLQIAAFLHCYYPNDPATKSLLKTLRERSSLRELLNVPLLLGIILRLYKENRFTDERLKLYEAVVNDLVYKLDRSKSVGRKFKVVDESLRLNFLKFMAFELLLNDALDEGPETNPFVFSKDLLKEKARQFLVRENLPLNNAYDLVSDVTEMPLLREISRDNYAFTHTTLHEYLAASAFADFYQKKGNESEGDRIFCRALHNPTVVEMEVLPMMLGELKNASKLYESMEQLPESFTFANLRLLARGLGYGATISQGQLAPVIEHLVKVVLETKVESKPYFEVISRSFSAAPNSYLDAIAERLEQLQANCIDYLRMKITDALGYIGGDKAISVLRALLQDKLSIVRFKAAHWIGQLEDEKSVSALISALGDTDEQVVANAAHALVKIGTKESVAAVIEAARSENTKVRATAVFWLGVLGGEKALDIVKEILAGDDRGVRLKAVEALGFIGGDSALSILRTLFQGNDFGIRITSVRAAGQCGDEKAIEFLLAALRDSTGEVRMSAVDALVKIDGKRFVDVFIDALRDPHPYVRQHAAMALDLIADRKAIPALLTALDNKSQADIGASHRGLVLGTVAHALQHYKDEEVFQALIKLLREDEGNEGAANAAIALGRIGDKRAVEPLLNVLQSSFNYLRAHVAEGLGLLGDKRAAMPLIAVLQDKDDIVRMHVVEALGRLKDERAVEALLGALQYAGTASEEAALAFRFFEGRVFAEELSKALSHQNPFVRRKAVSYVGCYSVDPILVERISHMSETDGDDFVRRTALEAKTKYSHKLELLGFSPHGEAQSLSDNESREGVLVHEVGRIVSSAGHFFREFLKYDEGIDGEIEFRNEEGRGTGQRVYLQLKSGDSYLRKRKNDGKEIFDIKPRHAEYWTVQAYPVLLVIRNSGGLIRWMNVTEYLQGRGKNVRQIEFKGEPFTVESVKQMRGRFSGSVAAITPEL